MSKKEADDLQEFRQQLLESEEPHVKVARKLYDEWFAEYVPLYLLNDTPAKPPRNWDESHIWTEIDGFEERWLVNGFVAYDENDSDAATCYYLAEHPFSAKPLTLRVTLTVDQDCSECDGEGEDEEGEECYLCHGSGSLTTDFTDDSILSRLPAEVAPKYIGSVAELPDPPKASLKSVTAKKAKFCSECGNKLADNAKFCSDCGTAIS